MKHKLAERSNSVISNECKIWLQDNSSLHTPKEVAIMWEIYRNGEPYQQAVSSYCRNIGLKLLNNTNAHRDLSIINEVIFNYNKNYSPI